MDRPTAFTREADKSVFAPLLCEDKAMKQRHQQIPHLLIPSSWTFQLPELQ